MEVFALTIFLSLCLAGAFILFFLKFLLKKPTRGVEQDALLPLQDDSQSPTHL